MTKKLIEVALPLEAINAQSAREKSIRHGHPSTLHLWWARRPLAACRAVLFASIVDEPASRPDLFPTEAAQEKERKRLFSIIEGMVQWEAVNGKDAAAVKALEDARKEILKATDGNPPPVLDPFCGGGSIPLEAQRLGMEAHGSDLNPVAVLITKALIEIPPKFAGKPPVNPDAAPTAPTPTLPRWGREESSSLQQGDIASQYPSPQRGEVRRGERRGASSQPGEELLTRSWKGAQGLADDVRYYGQWMRDEAEKRIGHLYPKVQLTDELLDQRADLKAQGFKPGDELTVIAWLWARTVTCPNPACGAQMPLVRSFALSTKKNKKAWVEPIVDKTNKTVRFEVRIGEGEAPDGTMKNRAARCLTCEGQAQLPYIRDEAQAGRMSEMPLAIVAEGKRGRVYFPPDPEHESIARSANPTWKPDQLVTTPCHDVDRLPMYGMYTWGDAFTPRQLVALTTFSDLVGEARERVLQDAKAAGFHSSPQRGEAGRGAQSAHWHPTPIPQTLLQAARDLRKNMTDAEQLLWQCLRGKQLDGFKFRRQHPLERFVLDFYCVSAKLAIELDGGQHNTDDVKAKDAERTAYLERHGIRVIRFWNHEVFENLEGVLTRIWDALHGPSGSSGPPPNLPPLGGGIELDAERMGSKAGQVAEEIVQHLALLEGANVRITLEIEAEVPDGVPDGVIRTVTENCRTLKFRAQGFEER